MQLLKITQKLLTYLKAIIMNNIFNTSRFLFLFKRDIYENYKFILGTIFTVLSIFSVIILINVIIDPGDKNVSDVKGIFYASFFISAVFISGMAFSDFRNKEKTMLYLTLPASNFEKFLSNFLLTTIVFYIVFTIAFAIFNLLDIAIIKAITNTKINFFFPLDSSITDFFKVIIPTQSILLAGSATFKKTPLFFTTLYTFIFSLTLSIIILVITYYFIATNIEYQKGVFIFLDSNDTDNIISFKIIRIFIQYFMPVLFWIVTYLKIKEKEA
jgi:hypothetical protein